MKSSYALSPPIVIRVGKGHWRSPRTVVLEVESERHGRNLLPLQQFWLLMDDVIIYEGSGYGIEKFGEYVTSPNAPQELRLDEWLIK